MPQEFKKSASIDLRGISRLTVDAIIGVTDLVESFGQSNKVISTNNNELYRSESAAPKPEISSSSNSILNKIRLISRCTGNIIELPLGLANRLLENTVQSPKREALLSATNGVLGDHLHATNNPLAIDMQFRRSGLALEELELKELIANSNGKLLIMIHGSCMNDLQWDSNNHNHGEELAKELEMTPLYLRYNSGLHISDNGKQLSTLLQSLFAKTSSELQINIVAHSMGGLVARSACYYAKETQYSWHKQLQKIIFLGTPHHGAPLEKGGNWVDTILTKSRFSLPFASLVKIRSRGITDLRYGNILEQDWSKVDRFKKSGDQRLPVPLPEGIDCYAIAGCKAKKANKLNDELVGDGLVTVPSALGQHKNPKYNLQFSEDRQWVGRELGHIELLSNENVYLQMKTWLST
jgi:pimeloyl-ACP methyl ester carboxylesterase